MRTLHIVSIFLLFFSVSTVYGQKTFNEYVEKTGSEKIQKSISMDVFTKPVANKSATDGHGKNPYFTSESQLPKKIALITFNVNDLGYFKASGAAGGVVVTTFRHLTEAGGNMVATNFHDQSIDKLKASFEKYGVELQTPQEFLDTPEKIKFYNEEFVPQVSKLGEFMSNIENRKSDISASADDYRYFDMGAAFDFLRAESLGYDLTKELGVDAVFSIGFVIQTDKKEGTFHWVKMAMHGPNPVPKQDKKYVAQNSGNGYNNGQLYVGGTLTLKKPISFMEIRKEEIVSMDLEGIENIFAPFIDRFYSEIYNSIEKAK